MQSEGAAFSLKQLAVNGTDLKGLVPPQKTGDILHALLLFCAQDGTRNHPEILLKEAARLAAEGTKND